MYDMRRTGTCGVIDRFLVGDRERVCAAVCDARRAELFGVHIRSAKICNSSTLWLTGSIFLRLRDISECTGFAELWTCSLVQPTWNQSLDINMDEDFGSCQRFGLVENHSSDT